MTNDHTLDELARELRSRISPDFESLTVVPEEEDGVPPIFAVYPTRLMAESEIVSACQEMAIVIRRAIPDKSDGWSAAIIIEPWSGNRRSIYSLGWAGRADHWELAIA
jgi:hypothetical protein